jgi:hypothetical protein
MATFEPFFQDRKLSHLVLCDSAFNLLYRLQRYYNPDKPQQDKIRFILDKVHCKLYSK